jgi:hypothetical protein
MEEDLSFLKMEDLNFFENGRRPQFLKMEDYLKKIENGRRPQFSEREDDLNIFENGRKKRKK